MVWMLGAGVEIGVRPTDGTLGGAPLHARLDAATREAFAPISRSIRHDGLAATLERIDALLAESQQTDAFGRLASVDETGTSWTVHPAVLHPPTALARWTTLVVQGPTGGITVEVGDDAWAPVHDLLAAAAAGTCVPPDPADPADPAHEITSSLFTALRGADLLVEQPAPPRADTGDHQTGTDVGFDRHHVVFDGHNMVELSTATTCVVVDPFLRPPTPAHPSGYRPRSMAEIGPVDAIAITHSHPDHFDPGSLLRFPRTTPIIVPALDRETMLSIDMAHRLRQLGFDHVHPLAWWDEIVVGDITVRAMPFFGEQPTDTVWTRPDVRNAGNTYWIDSADWRVALLADAAWDGAGRMHDVAAEARRRWGRPDLVFGGYRSWSLYPPQLLDSSVARYLLLVPPALWGERQQLMAGIDDALDIAAAFEARGFVPYADGGAPWFWDLGLGPRLDDQATESDTDPFPERVLTAAAARADGRGGPSHPVVGVHLLRPNDRVTVRADEPPLISRPVDNGWPYGDLSLDPEQPGSQADSTSDATSTPRVP